VTSYDQNLTCQNREHFMTSYVSSSASMVKSFIFELCLRVNPFPGYTGRGYNQLLCLSDTQQIALKLHEKGKVEGAAV